jgi:hypothetical protein
MTNICATRLPLVLGEIETGEILSRRFAVSRAIISKATYDFHAVRLRRQLFLDGVEKLSPAVMRPINQHL